MAVKKNFQNGSSLLNYKDIYDTQDALDSGILGSANISTTKQYTDGSNNFFSLNSKRTRDITFNENATSDTLGSLLGQSEILNSYKKKKQEQTDAAKKGISTSQSILGGTVI